MSYICRYFHIKLSIPCMLIFESLLRVTCFLFLLTILKPGIFSKRERAYCALPTKAQLYYQNIKATEETAFLPRISTLFAPYMTGYSTIFYSQRKVTPALSFLYEVSLPQLNFCGLFLKSSSDIWSTEVTLISSRILDSIVNFAMSHYRFSERQLEFSSSGDKHSKLYVCDDWSISLLYLKELVLAPVLFPCRSCK